MDWKPQYTIALIPPMGAIAVSVLVLAFGGSVNTGQWAAVIFFFVSLPFAIGRLIP